MEEVDVARRQRCCVTKARWDESSSSSSAARPRVRRNGRKIAELGPGGYFGELSLLDRKPRSATVVSDTDMTLLVLDQRRFTGLLEEMPTLAHKLLIAMTKRLRDADAKASSWS